MREAEDVAGHHLPYRDADLEIRVLCGVRREEWKGEREKGRGNGRGRERRAEEMEEGEREWKRGSG